MQLLPEVLKKNGMTLKQIKRNDKKALYSVTMGDEGPIVGYEVWNIVVRPAEEAFGKSYPDRESPPSNEDFGSTAWSFSSRERAEQLFN